jgi:hypothetical protein
MQQKITKRQNARHNPKKVVVVKKNNGKLEVIQGQVSDLTGNLDGNLDLSLIQTQWRVL